MAYDVTTTPSVGDATKRSDYTRLRDAVKALAGIRHFLGGSLDKFVQDTTYVDAPDGFEVEIDGTNLSGLSVYLEANAVCEVTAAVSCDVKLQYWTGAAWADVAGAAASVALTTAYARGWNKSSTFTLPSGVNRIKFVYKGTTGAANRVAAAAWVSIRG